MLYSSLFLFIFCFLLGGVWVLQLARPLVLVAVAGWGGEDRRGQSNIRKDLNTICFFAAGKRVQPYFLTRHGVSSLALGELQYTSRSELWLQEVILVVGTATCVLTRSMLARRGSYSCAALSAPFFSIQRGGTHLPSLST